MKIHLRKRKQSNNGKINLFVEFYKGYKKFNDHKVYEKDKGANFYMAKYIDKEIDYDIFGL
tara:strand:+ start:184 stop:366 length:183 start_codon:yes stop_codon:yes gene_type:complete